MHGKPRLRRYIEPDVRDQLTAEFRERWARAGYPSLVHHILGNMSEAHGISLGVLKEIARAVRADHEQNDPRPEQGRPAARRAAGGSAALAVVDGSNLAWARLTEDGHPRVDNLLLARTALAERGYQALVVVDAALRHQLGQRDAAELDRQVHAQEVIQAPAATDADLWVLSIAEHHGAPVVSNDRFDEYRADFEWVDQRRVAVVFVEHAALLQGGALDGSGRPPATPAALREEIEELRTAAANTHARTEDVAALRSRIARLEGILAREQARSAEAQAELTRVTELLRDERRVVDGLRQEIREHPEQVLRLSRDLGDAQEDAATLRSQRDGLQTRIRELEHQMHQVSSRRPEERAVAASRADLDALRGELRGEIRDLARAVKDAQSPLPRILAMTREVREAILAVQKTQGQNSGRLESLEQASQSLLMTADYLAAIAEETDADEEDDEEVFMDVGDDDDDAPAEASVAEGVAPADGDVVEAAASTKTTTNRDDWQSEFDRVEEAWLAGRRVGDVHEELNFLHLLADLRMDALPRAQIVAAFDRFRARAGGERFSYCPGAVHIVRARKPSLDNPLVLVRYRELSRMPPCSSPEACPGIGYGVEELRKRK